jgi:hypothetical protein
LACATSVGGETVTVTSARVGTGVGGALGALVDPPPHPTVASTADTPAPDTTALIRMAASA